MAKHKQRAVTAYFVGLLVLLGCVLAVPGHAALPPDKLDTAAVDVYVQDYLDRHGLVGAQVAIVHQGHVVHTAGYGRSEDGATTAQTPMAIGSVSKQITSVALLQLVEDGSVGLDDPVVEHLPEFTLADQRAHDITLRQLLSHTSGIPSPLVLEPASDLHDGVQRLAQWTLESDPGTQYRYSNMNYHVAARLIEKVSQQPFSTYLHQNIFQPLGMNDTRTVTTTRADDPGLQDGHVTAYGMAIPLREMEQLVAGAGGVITTADDLAKWLVMVTSQGTAASGEQLLAPKLLKEAQSSQPGTNGEGLGWHLSGDDAEPARVWHPGAISSYGAQLDVVPSSGYGVALQLNSYTPSWEHYSSINSGIIDITEGNTPQLGIPVAVLIDAGLGILTLLSMILMGLGMSRAIDWSRRRAAWPTWRYMLRLSPQTFAPILALLLFVVFPNMSSNSVTLIDIFGFWPALMVLVLALAVSGSTLTIVRVFHRRSAVRTWEHCDSMPRK